MPLLLCLLLHGITQKVREAISILDLDVTVYPCPKGGQVWRPKAVELGGKAQFPFLVDNNTGETQQMTQGLYDVAAYRGLL